VRLELRHDAAALEQIAELEKRDGYVSDISLALRYRPGLFAAFVSVRNQCPF
jgi:hypothetical protein